MKKKNISFVLELMWWIFWFLIVPPGGVFYLSHFVFHTSVIDTYYMTILFFLVFSYLFIKSYSVRLEFHPIIKEERTKKIIELLGLLWRFILIICILILFILNFLFESFTIIQIILQLAAYGIVLGIALLCIKIATYFVMKTFKEVSENKAELQKRVEVLKSGKKKKLREKIKWRVIKRLGIWMINLYALAVMSFLGIYLVLTEKPLSGVIIWSCAIPYTFLFFHLVKCDIKEKKISP